MRDLSSSRTKSWLVRSSVCYVRGGYDCGGLASAWQIRCRAGSFSPTELTSRRIGTWADMFCRGTRKRRSSSQGLTAPDDYRDIGTHNLQGEQTSTPNGSALNFNR